MYSNQKHPSQKNSRIHRQSLRKTIQEITSNLFDHLTDRETLLAVETYQAKAFVTDLKRSNPEAASSYSFDHLISLR